MTEDQAREKWCPFADIGPGNRIATKDGDTLPMHGCFCIASDCMAWIACGEDVFNDDGTVDVVLGGWCGLAGKA